MLFEVFSIFVDYIFIGRSKKNEGNYAISLLLLLNWLVRWQEFDMES